jgi:hypothetical protein
VTNGGTVELAALGIVATSVTALVWIVKFLMKDIKDSLDKNTSSHERVADVTSEILTFLKNLNGKLADITAQKVEAQKTKRKKTNGTLHR